MSWVKMNMKFPGKCIVCNKPVTVGQSGLWARGIGVKHEECAESTAELKCMVCGSMAGCASCEFADSCNLQKVSQMCICSKCSKAQDPLSSYLGKVLGSYPSLNVKI